jgi:hypothetical protein
VNMTVIRQITLEDVRCGACDITFAAPDYFIAARRQDGAKFYCPNGHTLLFEEGENERLRKRLETCQTQLTHERDQREAAERSNAALRGVVTRKTSEARRVANGVCPCCNRSFTNLRRHMSGQHPDYEQSEPTK